MQTDLNPEPDSGNGGSSSRACTTRRSRSSRGAGSLRPRDRRRGRDVVRHDAPAREGIDLLLAQADLGQDRARMLAQARGGRARPGPEPAGTPGRGREFRAGDRTRLLATAGTARNRGSENLTGNRGILYCGPWGKGDGVFQLEIVGRRTVSQSEAVGSERHQFAVSHRHFRTEDPTSSFLFRKRQHAPRLVALFALYLGSLQKDIHLSNRLSCSVDF